MSSHPPSDDPRRDVIEAAARIFRSKGFGGASVREIAAEAGLRKASLYYYFPSKEEIVYAMIEGILDPALAMQRRLGRAVLSEAAKLYLYLRFDIELLCGAPYDCSWLLQSGDLSDPRILDYWKERNRLIVWLAARLKQGKAKGEFVDCDAKTVANALLAVTEYSVTWAERRDTGKIARTAEEVAGVLLRGLLAPGRKLGRVKAEAAAFLRKE